MRRRISSASARIGSLAARASFELAELHLAPEVAAAGLLQEREQLRGVQADAVGPRPGAGPEARHEVVGEAVQLLAGELEPVLELVDVPLEGGLELDQAQPEGADLGPRAGDPGRGRPGAGRGPAAPGSGRRSPASAAAASLAAKAKTAAARSSRNGKVDAPAVEPLLGLLAGVAHGRVGVHVAQERGGGVAGRDAAPAPRRAAGGRSRRCRSRRSRRPRRRGRQQPPGRRR